MNTTWETHKFEHYIFSLLLAVEVIMSFTFLGYVHIPPISITTAYIPIIITACLFGPAEASLAGLLFGLGSLYKASATYVMPADAVFSPFRSDFPIGSILLSVGTRVLFGFLLGCLFQLARKSKRKNLCKLLITIAAPKLHALLVYTAMGLFFPSLGFNFSSIFMLEKSDLIILLFCVAVVLAIDKLYHSSFIQTYKKAVNEYENTPYWSPKIGFVLGAVSTFIFCMAVLSTVYFSSRMYYMLGQHGIDVTQDIHRDILHLQVQFLKLPVSLLLQPTFCVPAFPNAGQRGDVHRLQPIQEGRLNSGKGGRIGIQHTLDICHIVGGLNSFDVIGELECHCV